MMDFDDVVLDSIGVYTQICQACLDKHPEIEESFSYSPGPAPETICGVAGCNNEASYYVDFVVLPPLTQEQLNKLKAEYYNP